MHTHPASLLEKHWRECSINTMVRGLRTVCGVCCIVYTHTMLIAGELAGWVVVSNPGTQPALRMYSLLFFSQPSAEALRIALPASLWLHLNIFPWLHGFFLRKIVLTRCYGDYTLPQYGYLLLPASLKSTRHKTIYFLTYTISSHPLYRLTNIKVQNLRFFSKAYVNIFKNLGNSFI